MRFDRFVTLRMVAPWIAARARESVRLPVLMYHAIAEQTDESLTPYFRTVTSPARFASQMEYLAREGYRAITLSTALHALRGGAQPEQLERTVVITFDDGLADVYTTAWPIMKSHGFTGTVFVSTDFIGRRFITDHPCLDVAQLRELSSQGLEFGSHTASHPQLKDLPLHSIETELARSKARLEDVIGSEVALFSYPYRFPEEDRPFVEQLAQTLSKVGYRGGVTTVIGRAGPGDPALFLKRLPVNDCDDVDLFKAKLIGAYDWLHGAQLGYKRTRALVRRVSMRAPQLQSRG